MLQFITHTNSRFDHLQSAEIALKGGCKWIQLRMKDLLPKEIELTAIQVRDLCERSGATFIIDDHVELTKKVNAGGVHLGKNDMSPTEARKMLGSKFIIGGTANTFEDIVRLVDEGVDYIGLGPFRFTETKKNLSPIIGLPGYRDILNKCKNAGISIPMVAIGGITFDDIADILKTGMPGIALSSTVLRAIDPVEEMRKIIAICPKAFTEIMNKEIDRSDIF